MVGWSVGCYLHEVTVAGIGDAHHAVTGNDIAARDANDGAPSGTAVRRGLHDVVLVIVGVLGGVVGLDLAVDTDSQEGLPDAVAARGRTLVNLREEAPRGAAILGDAESDAVLGVAGSVLVVVAEGVEDAAAGEGEGEGVVDLPSRRRPTVDDTETRPRGTVIGGAGGAEENVGALVGGIAGEEAAVLETSHAGVHTNVINDDGVRDGSDGGAHLAFFNLDRVSTDEAAQSRYGSEEEGGKGNHSGRKGGVSKENKAVWK